VRDVFVLTFSEEIRIYPFELIHGFSCNAYPIVNHKAREVIAVNQDDLAVNIGNKFLCSGGKVRGGNENTLFCAFPVVVLPTAWIKGE
jgi:hypothetical protein